MHMYICTYRYIHICMYIYIYVYIYIYLHMVAILGIVTMWFWGRYTLSLGTWTLWASIKPVIRTLDTPLNWNPL